MSDCLRFRFGSNSKSGQRCSSHPVGRVEDWSAQRVQRQRSCARCQVVVVRLSRIEDYLVDNIYAHILS
jgi:hypothetical protein